MILVSILELACAYYAVKNAWRYYLSDNKQLRRQRTHEPGKCLFTHSQLSSAMSSVRAVTTINLYPISRKDWAPSRDAGTGSALCIRSVE